MRQPKGFEWRKAKLDHFAEVRAGSAFPLDYQGKKEGEYPFYKVSDMNAAGNEVQMCKSTNRLDLEDVRTLKAKSFPANTVIFPKVGAALHTNKKRLLTTESLLDNNLNGSDRT